MFILRAPVTSVRGAVPTNGVIFASSIRLPS